MFLEKSCPSQVNHLDGVKYNVRDVSFHLVIECGSRFSKKGMHTFKIKDSMQSGLQCVYNHIELLQV